MNDVTIPGIPLPVDIKYSRKHKYTEKLLRIETDQMEICKPKNFRKKIWLGFRVKLCFVHLDKNGNLNYWEK